MKKKGRMGREGGWEGMEDGEGGREDGGRDENTCLVYKPWSNMELHYYLPIILIDASVV